MNEKNNEIDLWDKLAEELNKFFQGRPEKKYTLNEYYEIVCKYIEKLMIKTTRRNNKKCFGGKCDFFLTEIKENSSNFSLFGGDKIEYVISNIILYFKDDEGKWETLKTMGRIKSDRFNLEDNETEEFIIRLKNGEKLTENIDPL